MIKTTYDFRSNHNQALVVDLVHPSGTFTIKGISAEEAILLASVAFLRPVDLRLHSELSDQDNRFLKMAC